MNTLKLIAVTALLSSPVMAQDETLFSGEIESGWYGGLTFRAGQLNGRSGFFIGGQGGWIISHSFVLGGKGYIMVNPADVPGLQNIVVGFGCGGALLEYIVASDKLVHVSVESMIGIGGVYNDVGNEVNNHDPIEYTGDACIVLEPGVNLMLNVTPQVRVGLGATYRYVNGIEYDPGAPYRIVNGDDYENISDADVSGLTAQLVLKFGAF